MPAPPSLAVTLPRTVELRICASDEQAAQRAAEEFVVTASANALRFWDNDEPITDEDGRPLGAVQIEMSDEGEIELATDAVEITAREEARQ